MAAHLLSIGTFNAHAAIDGFARPFDLVETCSAIDADLLVLCEVFTPPEGPSQAAEVATALGYHCVEHPFAEAWRLRQPVAPPGERRWEPRRPYARTRRALLVGDYARETPPAERYEEGHWGIAVLSRPEILGSKVIDLGRLRRDFTPRAALSVSIDDGFTLVAAHMSHFSHGSARQFLRLARSLPPPDRPAALAGDMNLFGPPLTALLRGWHRAARGASWPAERPFAQLDHVFVTHPVSARGSSVLRAGNSDHLPVRAEIGWRT
jgi:endonuclease/exonuclease/phosphatase family metal-dependent hydrolase